LEKQVHTTISHRVPFFDVDLMAMVWHGHYLKYFEMARQKMIRQAGLDLEAYVRDGGWAFPVIKTSVKYLHPLRFGQDFTCTAILVEAKVKIVLEFEVRLLDGTLCAKGRSEQCAVRTPELEMEMLIPEDVQEALWSLAG
jgi:acyl-CoA thioester hydrolase